MRQDIKERWVTALRSGDYVQGRDQLKTGDTYCCLGVLCDLSIVDGIGHWKDDEFYTPHGGYAVSYLASAVVEWAGLPNDCPHIDPENDGPSLATMNDGGKTFEEIAQAIEEHL